jgi:hypothetical protein
LGLVGYHARGLDLILDIDCRDTSERTAIDEVVSPTPCDVNVSGQKLVYDGQFRGVQGIKDQSRGTERRRNCYGVVALSCEPRNQTPKTGPRSEEKENNDGQAVRPTPTATG